MRIFGPSEAGYYCKSYSAEAGLAEGSLKEFHRQSLDNARITSLREGTSLFSQYRACSLRDAERSLFFAASHYRRCLDLMVPSASPWTFVTIYYGSFYAARALLAMFGCTIFNKHVVDVARNTPGNQELAVRSIGTRPGQVSTTYNGSHRQFWDLYYRAVVPLRAIVAPQFIAAISPTSGDPVWQIDRRNQLNYDTFHAIRLTCDFLGSFSKANFPISLPGILGTQYAIFESLLELAFQYARQFTLQTDALGVIGVGHIRRNSIRKLVYGARIPALVSVTKKQALLRK